MTEITDFAAILLALGAGVALAVLSTRLTTWIPIPSPAVFLIVAAVVSDLFPASTRKSRPSPWSGSPWSP